MLDLVDRSIDLTTVTDINALAVAEAMVLWLSCLDDSIIPSYLYQASVINYQCDVLRRLLMMHIHYQQLWPLLSNCLALTSSYLFT